MNRAGRELRRIERSRGLHDHGATGRDTVTERDRPGTQRHSNSRRQDTEIDLSVRVVYDSSEPSHTLHAHRSASETGEVRHRADALRGCEVYGARGTVNQNAQPRAGIDNGGRT